MNAQVSLLSYLKSEKFGLTDSKILGESEMSSMTTEFHDFLHQTVVLPIDLAILDTFCVGYIPNRDSEFDEFIEDLLRELHSKTGMSLWKEMPEKLEVRTGASNPVLSSEIGYLKKHFWKRLCNNIGRRRFAILLATSKCYVVNNACMVFMFGPRLPRTYPSTTSYSTSGMFYRSDSRQRKAFLSNMTELGMMSVFCELSPNNMTQAKLRKILQKSYYNEKRIVYPSLLRKFDVFSGPLQNRTPMNVVARFAILCAKLIIPTKAFGSRYNWRQTSRLVAHVVKLPRSAGVRLEEWALSYDLRSIEWLKSRGSTSNKDREKRRLLQSFLQWFLDSYISKLVSAFWYVSEDNISHKNVFTPQAVWRASSSSWLEGYILNYLEPIPDQSFVEQWNLGHLRMIPKLLDFRPLCIPHKDRRGNFEYALFDKDVITPIRGVLRICQSEQDERAGKIRCASVSDVCDRIRDFKLDLVSCHGGNLPEVTAIKFDMKHCYDNLNQLKIFELAEKLLRQDSYFVKKFDHKKAQSEFGKVKLDIHDELTLERMLRPQTTESGVIEESNKTLVFTKTQILEHIRLQVLDSKVAILSKRGVYKRRGGVFQGFPLLSTLCDIVYNEMMDTMFKFILEDKFATIIRLADDFLVLSIDRNVCDRALEVASSPQMADYGAFINQEKVKEAFPGVSNNSFDFLGLKINLKTLECTKVRCPRLMAYDLTYTSVRILLRKLHHHFQHIWPRTLARGEPRIKTIRGLLRYYIRKLETAIGRPLSKFPQSYKPQIAQFLIGVIIWTFTARSDSTKVKLRTESLIKVAFQELHSL